MVSVSTVLRAAISSRKPISFVNGVRNCCAENSVNGDCLMLTNSWGVERGGERERGGGRERRRERERREKGKRGRKGERGRK